MQIDDNRFKLGWVSIVGVIIFVTSLVTGLFLTRSGVATGFLHPYSIGRNTSLFLVLIALIYLCLKLRGLQTFESYFWRYLLFAMTLNTAGSVISSLVSTSNPHSSNLIMISTLLFFITYIYIFTALVIEIFHLNNKITHQPNSIRIILMPIISSVFVLITLLIIYSVLPVDFTSSISNLTIISSYLFIVFDIITLILTMILLANSYTSNVFGIYGTLSFALLTLSLFHIMKLFTHLYNSPFSTHFDMLRIITLFLLLIAIDGRMHLKQYTDINQ